MVPGFRYGKRYCPDFGSGNSGLHARLLDGSNRLVSDRDRTWSVSAHDGQSRHAGKIAAGDFDIVGYQQ
jgi:hypothetical protein